jgi:mono/diheme cytochrome c family protein
MEGQPAVRVSEGFVRLPAQVLLLCLVWFSAARAETPAQRFQNTLEPLFIAKCSVCHGTRLQTKELNLTTLAGLMKGSESGPVIVAGKPDESRLYQFVRDGVMPKGGPRLSAREVETIKDWILHAGPQSAAAAPVTQHQVIPLLLLRCAVCHGSRRQEAGLDLRSKQAMLRGGKSGPAIVPGKPEDNLLIRKIHSREMPPVNMVLEVSVRPITTAETDLIAAWIAQGAPEVPATPDVAGTPQDPLVTAKDRDFWSFRPPKPASPPAVKHAAAVRNPIDAFVLRKLEDKGLVLAPEADRLTLIRRVTFDLIGMPPDPGEVRAFLADHDPLAYEKLVDRLLASPRYGERWARYWLDAAGYADSEGKNNSDPVRPTAFRYRDYVIRSLNADKGYDRFLLEQIAGDELADYEKAPVMTQELMDNLIATGFLNMVADATNQRDMGFVDDRLDVVADEIDVLSSTVMGLTIKCARCHSHKYDPIPQRDYYRLAAIFKGAYDEHEWIPPLDHYLKTNSQGRQLPYVEPGATPFAIAQQARDREVRNTGIDRKIADLKSALQESKSPCRSICSISGCWRFRRNCVKTCGACSRRSRRNVPPLRRTWRGSMKSGFRFRSTS